MTNLDLTTTKDGKQAVQCSTLYNALGLNPTHYARWIKKNIINNPFGIEGEDYIFLTRHNGEISETPTALTPRKDGLRNKQSQTLRQRRTRNRQRQKDFVLTLDFAKRLAMMSRTEKGEAVRRYFLQCEKRLTAIQNNLLQELEAYRELEAIKDQRRTLDRKAQQCRERIREAKEIIKYIQLTFNF